MIENYLFEIILLSLFIIYFLINRRINNKDELDLDSFEKKLNIILTYASIAVQYAEDLHHNGRLDDVLLGLGIDPNNLDDGFKKFSIAVEYLKERLSEKGIDVSPKEIQGHIASSYRLNMQDVESDKS